MRAEKIKKAKAEAKRFLERVKILEAKATPTTWGEYCSPKETGAVRRSSMDLTRALADMRKP